MTKCKGCIFLIQELSKDPETKKLLKKQLGKKLKEVLKL